MCKEMDGFCLLFKGNITVLYQRYQYGQPLTQCIPKKTSLYFEMVFTASTLYVMPKLRQLYAFILYPAAKRTINL